MFSTATNIEEAVNVVHHAENLVRSFTLVGFMVPFIALFLGIVVIVMMVQSKVKVWKTVLTALAILPFIIIPPVFAINQSRDTATEAGEELSAALRENIDANMDLDEYEISTNRRFSAETLRVTVETEIDGNLVEFDMSYDTERDVLRPIMSLDSQVVLPIKEGSVLDEIIQE